jgi:hypothetical protein
MKVSLGERLEPNFSFKKNQQPNNFTFFSVFFCTQVVFLFSFHTHTNTPQNQMGGKTSKPEPVAGSTVITFKPLIVKGLKRSDSGTAETIEGTFQPSLYATSIKGKPHLCFQIVVNDGLTAAWCVAPVKAPILSQWSDGMMWLCAFNFGKMNDIPESLNQRFKNMLTHFMLNLHMHRRGEDVCCSAQLLCNFPTINYPDTYAIFDKNTFDLLIEQPPSDAEVQDMRSMKWTIGESMANIRAKV